MKISIVTISFNQVSFLRECIDSVLSQENVDLEYIVVDPGSTDGSREIIEEYGGKIIKVFEPDVGPADGLNNGFERASGDIFGFINADDYFLPGALEIVKKFFENSPEADFVSGGGFIEFTENNKRLAIVPSKMKRLNLIYGACTVFQQGTFFRRRLFDKVGGFNKYNKTCWDGELFTDFVYRGYNHCTINSKLAAFRIHSNSISGSGNLNEIYKKDTERIFENKIGRKRNIFDSLLSLGLRVAKRVRLLY